MRTPTDYEKIQVKITKTMKKRLVSYANRRGWTLTHTVNQLVQRAIDGDHP
jgi:macrodomain Ter protein organizer (MatP/YcbG family)